MATTLAPIAGASSAARHQQRRCCPLPRPVRAVRSQTPAALLLPGASSAPRFLRDLKSPSSDRRRFALHASRDPSSKAKNEAGRKTGTEDGSQDIDSMDSMDKPEAPKEEGPRSSVNPIVKFFNLFMSRLKRMLLSLTGSLRSRQSVLLLGTGMLAAAMGIASIMGSSRRAERAAALPREVLYSEFLTMVKDKTVQDAIIDESGNRVYFTLRPEGTDMDVVPSSPESLRKDAKSFPFYTYPVKSVGVVDTLADASVNFAAARSTWQSALTKVFVTMFMLWIPMLPLFFMLRRMMDSRAGNNRKKRNNSSSKTPTITFADVAGVDVAKMELMETVACLKDAGRYKKLNAKMPSGVLLSGPPGTGKTLLAKAVAGEAGVPFFAASASEFVELFVGRGAARVRELFAEARKRAPCVVFIDELDAVGMKRGFGNNEERDQTLNQLLTELDGFEGRDGVLLLAATNRPEALDPALLRPGRLSRKVVVPVPDEAGRVAILGIHMRDVPFDPETDLNEAIAVTARVSGGFSGAELANVVNEAALLAARRGGDFVTLKELLQGVSRTRFGVQGEQPAPGSLGAKLQDWLINNARATPKVTSGQQLTS